jgi:TPR repeat protein
MRLRDLFPSSRFRAILVALIGTLLSQTGAAYAQETLRKKAEGGDVDAQVALAKALWFGSGVPQNRKEAIVWYTAAAEQGNASAQLWMGGLYLSGEEVAKDTKEAVRLIRLSAESGYAAAQGVLGSMFENAQGVPQSLSEALKWYGLGVRNDDSVSLINLGAMYARGGGVRKDATEAFRLWKRAADKGVAAAQVRVALCYLEGTGVSRDVGLAFRNLRLGALNGDASAAGTLGALYENGVGTPKDEIEALAWYGIGLAGNAKTGGEKHVAALEKKLGVQAVLRAQKRSKELIEEIEFRKNPHFTPDPEPSPNPPSGSASPRTQKRGIFPNQSDEPSEASKRRQIKGNGSGVVVSAQGHVLTAAHVVTGAQALAVMTADGEKAARVLRIDQANDLAVLKIDGAGLRPLQIGPSRRIRLGQAVSTIGFPNIGIQGFSPKVTKGEISSMNGASDDPRSWQISVPVQPGNSGGPLLDENGHLIGVVVSKLGLKAARAIGDIPQNVNYAVKIS